jgi:hypothetical protein
MDQMDGEKTQKKTRTVHTKFSIPLCCFGTGSQLDAEFNLTTNETTVETGDAETQPKQCEEKPTTANTTAGTSAAPSPESAVTTPTTTKKSNTTELGGSV